MLNTKKYDFILLGATSFVGASIIRYITNNVINEQPFSWAVAARSSEKMTEKLSIIPKDKRPDQFIVDTSNRSSIDTLCAQTKVIMSTIGPYAMYGENVIAACVDAGINYCDLTGESFWIAEMIEKYHKQATETGAFIIPSAGFDSIPSDFGMKCLQSEYQSRYSKPCNNVVMGVRSLKGALSGGTFASIINSVEEVIKRPALRKVLSNPYAQCQKDHTFSLKQRPITTPRYDKNHHSWLSSFLMESVNTSIIHRSNYLLNNAYTDKLLYSEGTLTGEGLSGAAKAYLLSFSLLSFFVLIAIKPTRALLKKFILPKPGEGPSIQAQDKGYFELHFYGGNEPNESVHIKLKGLSDPGYGWTAKALTQTALALAFDIPEHKSGGFWTTASLFDERFDTRLKNFADVSIDVLRP